MEQKPPFVPREDMLCWLFCSLVCIPYDLISSQPPENHVDVFCDAVSTAPCSLPLKPSRARWQAPALAHRAPRRRQQRGTQQWEEWQSWAMTWVELLTPVVPWEIAYLGMPVFLE